LAPSFPCDNERTLFVLAGARGIMFSWTWFTSTPIPIQPPAVPTYWSSSANIHYARGTMARPTIWWPAVHGTVGSIDRLGDPDPLERAAEGAGKHLITRMSLGEALIPGWLIAAVALALLLPFFGLWVALRRSGKQSQGFPVQATAVHQPAPIP
jgi:hypothetical protein